MTNTQYKALILQSKFNKDLNGIIDLISPIVATGKKVTQREITKANKLLAQKYGYNRTIERIGHDGNQERINIPLYEIALNGEGWTKSIAVYTDRRSIGDDERGIWVYIPESKKTIHLHGNTGGITAEEIARYKCGKLQTPTPAEIKRAFSRIAKIKAKIQALETEIHAQPFNYYYKDFS